MNINLISPADKSNQTENGNSYTIRFKEDIIIPENSKIHLNYASLSRDSEVEFYEDQTIRIFLSDTQPNTQSNEDVRPMFIPSGDFKPNVLFADGEDTFTISKGVYSYQLFQKKLSDGLNSVLTQNSNIADLGFYRAVEINDLRVASEADDVDFDLGFGIFRKSLEFDDFTPHATHTKNMDQDPDGDGLPTIAYRKTSANTRLNLGSIRARQKRTGTNGNFRYDGGLLSIALKTQGTKDKTAGDYSAGLDTTATSGTGAGLRVSFKLHALPDGSVEPPLPIGAGDLLNTLGLINGGADDHNIGTHSVDIIGGSGGAGATADLVIGAGGAPTSITLTARGSGYTDGEECNLSHTYGGTDDIKVIVARNPDGIEIIADVGTDKTGLMGGSGYAINDEFKIDGMGGTDDTRYEVKQLAQGNQLETWDNYAISAKTLWTGGQDDNTPFKETCVIKATSLKSYNDMDAGDDAICIGIQSQEVMSGLFGKLATNKVEPLNGDFGPRTSGSGAKCPDGTTDNPLNLPITNQNSYHKYPACYFLIALDFRSGKHDLVVKRGVPIPHQFPNFKSTIVANNQLRRQKAVNFPIRDVKAIFKVDISNHAISANKDEKLRVGVQLYRKASYSTGASRNINRRIYYRVLNLNSNPDPNKSVLENNKDMGGAFIMYDSGGGLGGREDYFNEFFLTSGEIETIDYESGSVSALIAHDVGTADKNNGTYNNIEMLPHNANTGTGLICNVEVAGGNVVPEGLTIVQGGEGYDINSKVRLPNTGGIGGTADTTFAISANDGTNNGVNTRRNKINSQNPFNIYLSALHQHDGWEEVSAPSYNKVDTKPITFLHTYELEGTEEIAKELNLLTITDRQAGNFDYKDPNSADPFNGSVIHLTNFNLNWRNESYSIYIEELPLKNLKNNELVRNGGFAKSILANIPAPFQDGSVAVQNNKQRITSVFEPNYQVVSNLYNQQLSTNQFKVVIRRQKDDKPATEIKNSIINFTIVPPDDYKGNINSAGPLLRK